MPTMLLIHATKVKYMISTAKVHHEKALIQNLTSNPKALYGYVKSKSKIRASISKPDGSLTKNDSETAKELNRFFNP